MALALTVGVDAPRLAALLTASGMPTGTATLSISRVGPSGTAAGVRGAVRAAVADPFVVHDFEVPLGVSVTYTVTAYNAAGASLGTASAIFAIPYAACEDWLVDLARPLNSLVVLVESMQQLEYQVPAGIHRVLNRRAPVVTSLPGWTPSTELVLLTDTLDERDQVRALLGAGYPFLLRTAPEQGVGNIYFALTGFTEERFLTLGNAPERRFRIACVQIERPDPTIFIPVAPNTYANVKATFATYAALKAGVANYDALAYTYPAGGGPVDPWLPDDV